MTTNVTLTDVLKDKEGGSEGGNPEVISRAELDTLKSEAEAKAQAELQLADALKAQEELKAALADLEKAKEEQAKQLADIEKARQDAKLAELTDVVKGFNLFDEDKIEDVSKFLLANEESPVTSLILTSLEKAKDAIVAFGTEEKGSDLEGIVVDSDTELSNTVKDMIKSRKAAQ